MALARRSCAAAGAGHRLPPFSSDVGMCRKHDQGARHGRGMKQRRGMEGGRGLGCTPAPLFNRNFSACTPSTPHRCYALVPTPRLCHSPARADSLPPPPLTCSAIPHARGERGGGCWGGVGAALFQTRWPPPPLPPNPSPCQAPLLVAAAATAADFAASAAPLPPPPPPPMVSAAAAGAAAVTLSATAYEGRRRLRRHLRRLRRRLHRCRRHPHFNLHSRRTRGCAHSVTRGQRGRQRTGGGGVGGRGGGCRGARGAGVGRGR